MAGDIFYFSLELVIHVPGLLLVNFFSESLKYR